MPAATKQVLFAEEELTIHKKLSEEPLVDANGNESWHIESAILLPGRYVSVDELPPYLVDLVKNKKVPGAKLMSETRAKKVATEAARLRALASQAKVVVDQSSTINADSVKLAGEVVSDDE